MKKVILIGGYPKGYSIPFHPQTHSGRILRGLLEEIKFDPELFNLWTNNEEEMAGIISQSVKVKLNKFIDSGYGLVALGMYQYNTLKKNNISCTYLPHPACRRNIDRQKLKEGLRNLK